MNARNLYEKGILIFFSGTVIATIASIAYISFDEYSQYEKLKKTYIDNPSQENSTHLKTIIEKQGKPLIQSLPFFKMPSPFEDDNRKDILIDRAIGVGQYDFAGFILDYLPKWSPDSVANEALVNTIPFYKEIGKKLENVDSSLLPLNVYNIKAVYALNTMSAYDFYNKYSLDILKSHHHATGVYLQSVLYFFGCTQEEKVWKSLTNDVTAAAASEYDLPAINDINEELYFRQKNELAAGNVPDISLACKSRMVNSNNLKIKYYNGGMPSTPNSFSQ